MVNRAKLLSFVVFSVAFSFLLQLIVPPQSAAALSLDQCTFSYTDGSKNTIKSDCQGKLPEGNYKKKNVEQGKVSYYLESEVNDQGLVDKCSAYIVVVQGSNTKGGKIGGTIAEKNGVQCSRVDDSTVEIDLTASNNDIRDNAANKVIREKLADDIQKGCQGLGTPDAITSCISRGTAAINACEDTARDAATRADTVGGAGTDASAVYLATIAPCIADATGLSESEIKKELGPDAYKDASKASTNAKVTEDCVLDGDGKCITGEEGAEKTSCGIDGIGWIVCPLLTFSGKLSDGLFSLVAAFLTVDPELTTSPMTVQAWGQMRNFANIMFVIAFLFIIYSQMTGAGISNYGIKKLLPKLVIAAILVNTSLFICQIAVDLSNILGHSLREFFTAIAGSEALQLEVSKVGSSTSGFHTAMGGIILGILALTGIIVFAMLALLFPLLLLIIITLLIIMVILIARQALIVILLIVSPLAFVAYLLPNTEQWFQKWKKMFVGVLIVFPMISVVFGASSLAGTIFQGVGADLAGSGLSPSLQGMVFQIAAVAIAIVPMIVVPGMLKRSMAAVDGLGGKMAGWGKGSSARFKGTAKEGWNQSSFARGMADRKNARKSTQNRRYAEAVAGKDTDIRGRMRRRLAGGVTGRRWTDQGMKEQEKIRSGALAAVTAADNKEYAENMEVARQAQQAQTTGELLADIQSGKFSTAEEKSAAIDRIMSSGSFGERQDLVQEVATNGGNYTDSHVDSAVQGSFAKGDNGVYGNAFGAKIKENRSDPTKPKVDLGSEAVAHAASGSMTAEQWAASGSASKWQAGHVAASGNTAAASNLKKIHADASAPGAPTAAKISGDHRTGVGLLP